MTQKYRPIKIALTIVIFNLAMNTNSFSQTGDPGYYNQAAYLFSSKNYFEAAQIYEKYLKSEKQRGASTTPFAVEKKSKGKSNLNMHEESVYALGDCYRQLHDYVTAEKYYKEATAFPVSAFPLAKFWYGVCLKANEKYDEAFKAITEFQSSYTEMGPVLIESDLELESIKFIKTELSKNTNNFIVNEQLNDGNTSAYALKKKQGDTVVFTSIHQKTFPDKNKQPVYNNNIYQSAGDQNIIALSYPLVLKDSAEGQNGLACFTPDGAKMFFTRWAKNNGLTSASIYMSEENENGWSAPVRLGEPVNIDGYNSTQPFITDDGKYLLFASDRPGGLGGYDLWYAELDSNYDALNTTNFGNVINTIGDDEAPYYHQKTQTLVFSSNGRVGMGGFDIYYAKGNYQFSRWERPRNPGVPINSTKDDMYYISTDENSLWNTGWLSSDRSSGCCLALFSVREDNELFVNGTVVDCKTHKPLSGVDVILDDPRHAHRIMARVKSDSLGRYDFKMKNISVFEVSANKADYTKSSATTEVDLEPGRDTLHTDPICILRQQINIEPVQKELAQLNHQAAVGNFEYKKARLTAGTNSQLDELASIMKQNTSFSVEIGGYTDGIGGIEYNLRLAQKRVDACINYLVKKGISRDRLKGKAYGKCCPLEPETINGKDNPAARAKNRRVEYKLVE